MFSNLLCYLLFIFILNFAMAKFIPRFQQDLDEEEHKLLRSAYDTPTYDKDEYEESDDNLSNGNKLDLLKDGEWAIKAKLKELKAFNKALTANMASTKIKIKDLLENHLDAIKNHHHHHSAPVYHKKPAYQPYQSPVEEYPTQYPVQPQYAHQYMGRPIHDPYYGQ